MSLRWPPRLDLARTPTPLVRLPERDGGPGVTVHVKRDDLTGAALSGNKVRKLEFLCADARAQGADTLVTCGGVNSNHARATAVAAAQLGWRSHLVLRGEDRHPPEGNLLLSRMLGAEVTFITPAQWPERDAIMSKVQARLQSEGRTAYVIPEGGSNALGSMGYARAAQEILQQAEAQGVGVRRIFHACGSAGTTAGLAIGFADAHREDIDVIAVAVCNDTAYFDGRVRSILYDAVNRNFTTSDVRSRARWQILEGFKDPGYAQTTPEQMAAHARFARSFGLFLDPVYSGKALAALYAEAASGRLSDDGTVFVHTGGIFELFAFADEIDALEPATSRGEPG